jgi:hypothetical protein
MPFSSTDSSLGQGLSFLIRTHLRKLCLDSLLFEKAWYDMSNLGRLRDIILIHQEC